MNFIDLHRSLQADYVQDVAVFIMSNFRMPVFDRRIRKRLGKVAVQFYRFAREYAEHHGDVTFDVRLSLGLIRSFITSTRFVMTRSFARVMYQRARYLMERLCDHRNKSWESYRLREEILIY